MKIYIIDDKNVAKQLVQLFKLNSECVRLHWSRTIKNLPSEVGKALEVIENFVEEQVEKICSKDIFAELSNDDENILMASIRENTELKRIVGKGVIFTGEEIENVKKYIGLCQLPQVIIDALEFNENVIIF